MNKIQRLLQEHCPNGVEWETLGEVTEYEQLTAYLVKSTNYKNEYPTPCADRRKDVYSWVYR